MSYEEMKEAEEEAKKLDWFYYRSENAFYRSNIKFQSPWNISFYEAKIEHWEYKSEVFGEIKENKVDLINEIMRRGTLISPEEFWEEFFNE